MPDNLLPPRVDGLPGESPPSGPPPVPQSVPAPVSPSAVYPPGYPPMQQSTNSFAVASLVLGIVGGFLCGVAAILALVFGYKARREIDGSGGAQGGRGMAVAGIVLGSVWLGLVAAYLLFVAVAVASSSGSS